MYVAMSRLRPIFVDQTRLSHRNKERKGRIRRGRLRARTDDEMEHDRQTRGERPLNRIPKPKPGKPPWRLERGSQVF